MTQKKNREFWRIVKFVLFSASAGIIEMGVFALLNEWIRWSYWPCYLIALTVSVVWNFTLNRRFTFRSASNVPRAVALVLRSRRPFPPVYPFSKIRGRSSGAMPMPVSLMRRQLPSTATMIPHLTTLYRPVLHCTLHRRVWVNCRSSSISRAAFS